MSSQERPPFIPEGVVARRRRMELGEQKRKRVGGEPWGPAHNPWALETLRGGDGWFAGARNSSDQKQAPPRLPKGCFHGDRPGQFWRCGSCGAVGQMTVGVGWRRGPGGAGETCVLVAGTGRGAGDGR